MKWNLNDGEKKDFLGSRNCMCKRRIMHGLISEWPLILGGWNAEYIYLGDAAFLSNTLRQLYLHSCAGTGVLHF